MKITKNKILIVILIVASFLRIWNLNIVPPHLTPDEASLGYNAYSILKTAKDEHGHFLPIVFKSFGDYKPGLYIYATVPFVAIFGLNEWSVRLASALSGILIVYLLYLISKKIFKDDQNLSLLVALVASTNPWLIYFSRGAWEVNLSLMLTLVGIFYFYKSFEKTSYIFYSVFFFALTLIAYQGAKLSTGIVVGLMVVFYWRKFWNIEKKYLLLSGLLGFIITMPILFSLFSGKAGRLEVFSVFSYPRSVEYIQAMLDEGGERIGDLNYFTFHNEPLNFTRGILGRWFNHYSGRFLFFEGDWSNPRHSAPYQGMLLISDILILGFSLISIIKEKISKEKIFILFWLILASLPSVLSRDQVHAVRSMNMSVPLIFIIAFGANYLIRWFNNFKFKKIIYTFFVLSNLIGLSYFVDSYFIHLSAHTSKLWEYGFKQIVETVTPIQNNYKRIVVQQSFSQPYIYFLFYQKYDPAKYQKESSYVDSEYKGDVGYITKLDNIEFGPIDWSRNRGDHGTLFIADPLRIPPLDSNDEREFKLIREIKYLDEKLTAFRILEVK